MAQIAPFIFPQYFDNNGNPLSGGKIYAYAAGTTTPQATYSDAAGTVPNANPIVLSSSGRTKIFLSNLTYDFVIKNSLGVTIDSIQGVGSPSGGANSVVDTIAELRNLASGSFNYVDLGGYYSKGDGGDGRFYWDSTSVAADNGGTIISPASLPASGRWIRIFEKRVNVRWFGAKGDNIQDDTAYIQAAINSLSDGVVFFQDGTYKITSRLICRSNVWLEGQSHYAVLNGTQIGNPITDPAGNQNYPYIDINAVSNVQVTNLKVNGNGIWTATPFANPYGGGSSVGFTNYDVGVRIKGICSDIEVSNCYFTGVSGAIYGYGDALSTNIRFLNNTCKTLGTGNRFQHFNDVFVIGNKVESVLGNTTNPGDTSTASSKFADGLYFERCLRVVCSENIVSDVIRIGIVFESDNLATIKDRDLVIANNVLYNFHDHKGTEFNAGIWLEGGKSERPAIISGNTIYNSDQLGIQAANCVISGGSIRGCRLNGINGGNFTAIGVEITECGSVDGATPPNSLGFAMDCANSSAADSIIIKDCVIKNNVNAGISFQQSPGYHEVTGCYIENNGTSAVFKTASAPNNFGIRINRYYNNQKVIIRNNTFISSANGSPTNNVSTGQFYAILGMAGGDFNNTTDFISDNDFIFNGTLATYPTSLRAVPCAYGYDNTAGTVFYYDICGYRGNNTTKTPAYDLTATTTSGTLRFMGITGSAPVGGTYRAGDYFIKSSLAADQGMYLVCVADGTPGTWEERGWGNNIRTGGLKVTAGPIRSLGSPIAAEGTNLLQSFGVGGTVDQPAGNSESLDIGHAGAAGATIRVTKTGIGSYRDLSLQNNGGTIAKLGADGYFYQAIPGAAPADGNVGNNQLSWYLDETNNNLKLKLKYAAGTVQSAVLPLVPASNFTGTLTGCTTSPTATILATKWGNIVVLFIPALTATSNTTGCTITGMPAALRPSRTINVSAPEIADNGSFYIGALQIDSSGVITLKRATSATSGLTTSFTNAGTKGISTATVIVYSQD